MKRIRKGDTVIVKVGKSKGLIGKIMQVKGDKLLVEGANLVKKHVKPHPQKQIQGGIVSKECLIDASNVSIYNTKLSKPDKVGFRIGEKDGVQYKERYFKSNNEVIY